MDEGEGEEADPEGEVVAGPSEEAIVHSSGNMPLLPFLINLFPSFFPKHLINLSLLHFTVAYHSIERWISILNLAYLSYFWSILYADESKGEGDVKVETKEEQELGTLQSWMEVGGLPALDEEEVQKLLQEVYLLDIWISP